MIKMIVFNVVKANSSDTFGRKFWQYQNSCLANKIDKKHKVNNKQKTKGRHFCKGSMGKSAQNLVHPASFHIE